MHSLMWIQPQNTIKKYEKEVISRIYNTVAKKKGQQRSTIQCKNQQCNTKKVIEIDQPLRTGVLLSGKQVPLHRWHPSCYSCYAVSRTGLRLRQTKHIRGQL